MTDWYCPNCPQTARTTVVVTHSRFHACWGMAGLTTPMLPVGVRARVYAREREDYVGTEKVQVDGNGRPIMSVVTERDDGQDVTVYAPLAVGRIT